MAKWVVDWDGTCITEEWPGMGDWLPGAIDGLKELHEEDGGVIIASLRTHNFEMGDEIRRPHGDQAFEVARMRAKLDDAGLHAIPIYPNDRGKAPGRYYLDDRAVVFDQARGGWRKVTQFSRAHRRAVA